MVSEKRSEIKKYIYTFVIFLNNIDKSVQISLLIILSYNLNLHIVTTIISMFILLLKHFIVKIILILLNGGTFSEKNKISQNTIINFAIVKHAL